MNLNALVLLFKQVGCRSLYGKIRFQNDNSKQQVYFGPGFGALSLFPNQGIRADAEHGNNTFKAHIQFAWLNLEGQLEIAPGAQLILYPQYPEVRFSGFLKGCRNAPSEQMTKREQGRVLFLGVTNDEAVIGYVAAADCDISGEFIQLHLVPDTGVFTELSIPMGPLNKDPRTGLLTELSRIHQLGWINSKRLGSGGQLLPCKSTNCGGYTLEAELGIIPNGRSEPDYLGYEVKQTTVSRFDNPTSGIITLMTPEPNGGLYTDEGTKVFLYKYGYPDKRGREDRINFGGNFKVGKRNENTGLTMCLIGYCKGKIYDKNGAIALISDNGEIAASWNFQGIMEHWTRKHAHAAYVPSMLRMVPTQQYCYSRSIRLASKPDFMLVLHALENGIIYYDPGIKLECASGTNSRVKKRSQFRIKSKDLAQIYGLCETVDVVS